MKTKNKLFDKLQKKLPVKSIEESVRPGMGGVAFRKDMVSSGGSIKVGAGGRMLLKGDDVETPSVSKPGSVAVYCSRNGYRQWATLFDVDPSCSGQSLGSATDGRFSPNSSEVAEGSGSAFNEDYITRIVAQSNVSDDSDDKSVDLYAFYRNRCVSSFGRTTSVSAEHKHMLCSIPVGVGSGGRGLPGPFEIRLEGRTWYIGKGVFMYEQFISSDDGGFSLSVTNDREVIYLTFGFDENGNSVNVSCEKGSVDKYNRFVSDATNNAVPLYLVQGSDVLMDLRMIPSLQRWGDLAVV